jgi:hypothetical protein
MKSIALKYCLVGSMRAARLYKNVLWAMLIFIVPVIQPGCKKQDKPRIGYLYIAIGDGGGVNDFQNGHVADWYLVNSGGNGQDVNANLLGNILRIDINNGSPYGIPADNPFVGKPGRDEIYAFGFRNPYRFSFDLEGEENCMLAMWGRKCLKRST